MDLPRPPLLKRLRPAHWVALDCVLVALLALVYGLGWRELASLRAPHWADAVIAAIAVVPAVFRRRRPRAVLALTAVSGAAAVAISASPAPSMAVAFVMYLIPLRFPRREALRLLAATLLVTVAGIAVFAAVPHPRPAPGIGGVLLGGPVLIAIAWLAGYSVWQQRTYTAGLHEQAQRRAREELAEARRAISEERLQIARELHDVVAHTMSLIAVQAGVANYVVATHPQEAARALSSIEETSRGALHEMRALLAVLRAEGDPADPAAGDSPPSSPAPAPAPALAPAPGLAALEELVERAAEAGVRIDLDVRGEQRRLSAGVDLAAYRVIQEAITNVIKHAATDGCHVAVDYGPETLTLRVTNGASNGRRTTASEADRDDGSGAAHLNDPSNADRDGADPKPGHGITGMRERVGMYGGQLRAAALPEGGFQVTARFPLADGAA